MKTLLIELAPEQIALLKAVIESYDNLATIRTEDPARHRLRVWFDEAHEHDIAKLLESLAPEVAVRRIDE